MKLIIDTLLGGMYFVSVEKQGEATVVCDEAQRPKCFQCLDEIRHYFSRFEFEQVMLREDPIVQEFMGEMALTSETRLNWS